MRRVHYLEDSRAHRILWLLEELGLDYDIKTYKRGPDMRAPRELKNIHPLGKSPVLEEDNAVYAESGAITGYLIDRYDTSGAFKPAPGTENGERYRYWMHYAEGSAMPLLLQKLLFTMLPKRAPALIRPVARKISDTALDKMVDPQLADHLAFWESELGRDGYFAGPDFSAADIMMSFPVEAAADRAMENGPGPATAAYLKAIRARPAYQKAVEKGAYRYSGS